MQQLKSWLTITLVVILSIPVSADNSETNPSVTLLNSDFLDGHWVNETESSTGPLVSTHKMRTGYCIT